MSKRALLIVNRGARRAGERLDLVRSTLRQLGIQLIEAVPGESESLSDLVLRHRDKADLVIIGGGDGTLNSAVDGLLEAQLPVGILPLGTANDLARTLELPTDPVVACQVIAAGSTRAIDVGRVNGKHFFNVASIGLSVAITRGLTQEIKRVWGVFAYLRTALQVLYGSRPFRAEIRTGDQVVHVRTIQISVGNGRYYGGGMTVCEDATIDDARLDLYSLEIERWWQVILLFPRLRTGALAASRHIRTLHGQTFEITTKKRRRINTDGEITGKTPARFEVLPRALQVFVPAPC